MKLNGVGISGIILLFIGSALDIIASIALLVTGFSTLAFFPVSGALISAIAVLMLVIPILVVIFGALAIAKKNNGLKIACGVLGLILIFVSWIAWIVGLIVMLVGGILTLCGKFVDENPLSQSQLSGFQKEQLNPTPNSNSKPEPEVEKA